MQLAKSNPQGLLSQLDNSHTAKSHQCHMYYCHIAGMFQLQVGQSPLNKMMPYMLYLLLKEGS
jgi:hypothetical protein